jgi:molybdopterin/thiamine biosynthesis adenylyltransferase
VGCIGIVDHDTVELSNLHRQPIHVSAELGSAKAASAASMAARNDDVDVVVFDERLTAQSSARIGAMRKWNVIVDCVDSPPARQEIARLAVGLEVPLVTGAVGAWDGQVGVFAPHVSGACAACWNPTGGASVLAGTCQENGVLGTAPALIGIMQATQVLKILAKLGDSAIGTTTVVDVLAGTTDRFLAHQRVGCEICDHVLRGSHALDVESDSSARQSVTVS